MCGSRATICQAPFSRQCSRCCSAFRTNEDHHIEVSDLRHERRPSSADALALVPYQPITRNDRAEDGDEGVPAPILSIGAGPGSGEDGSGDPEPEDDGPNDGIDVDRDSNGERGVDRVFAYIRQRIGQWVWIGGRGLGLGLLGHGLVSSLVNPRMRVIAGVTVAGMIVAQRIREHQVVRPAMLPAREPTPGTSGNLAAFLSQKATHERRTAELPKYLRKQAEAWRRQNEPEWSDQRFLFEYDCALDVALRPSVADQTLEQFVRDHSDQIGIRSIRYFNSTIQGVVPRYDWVCSTYAFFGLNDWADERAFRRAREVLPLK